MEIGCGGFGGFGVDVRVGVVGTGDGDTAVVVFVGVGSVGEAACRSSAVVEAHPDRTTLATNAATIPFPVIMSSLLPQTHTQST